MDEIELDIEQMKREMKQYLQEQGGGMNEHDLAIFKERINQLKKMYKEYKNKRELLKQQTDMHVSRIEHAKGGQVLHRGYYCPSLVKDKYLGNAKRGKIYKRTPKFGQYDYEYGFNHVNQLVRVKKVHEFTTATDFFDEEYLLYQDNVVWGIGFNHHKELNTISKCTFDQGQLISYMHTYGIEGDFNVIYYEEYHYDGKLLKGVHIADVNVEYEQATEWNYQLRLDEDGEIHLLET